jgi:hypothetical protein
MLGISLTFVHAQFKLNVKEKLGKQTSFALNSIRKLTFTFGNFTVNKTDNIISAYALSDIRFLNLSALTFISKISSEENSKLILFPNPVIDQLQISFKSTKAGNARIEIINLMGKILQQQNLNSPIGTNHVAISVA